MHAVNTFRDKHRKHNKLPPSVNKHYRHSKALDDDRFVLLDPGEIAELCEFFYDPDIQIAFTMKYDAALSGSIQFDRKKYNFEDDSSERWHAKVWREWTLEKETRKKQIGFAIGCSRPDPKYGARPTILNPQKVDIYHYEEPDGTHHLRVFEKNTDFVMNQVLDPRTIVNNYMTGLDERYEQLEIHDFEVFWEQKPDSHHRIRSVCQALSIDTIFSAHLINLTMQVNDNLANIPLVTEYVPDKIDPDSVSAMPNGLQLLGDGETPANSDNTRRQRTQAELAKSDLMRDLLAIRNSDGENRWNTMMQYIDKARHRKPENYFNQQIDLPQNRHLVQQQLPTPPTLLMN